MNLVKDGKCKEGLAALWRLAARGDYDAVWMVIETTSSGGFYFMPHAPIPDVHPLRGMTNTFPRSMLPVFLYATLSRGIFNGRSVIPKDETIRWAVTQLKAHGADSTGGQLIGCFSNLIDEMRTTNRDAQTKVSKARICVDLAETVGVIPPFEEFAAERIENPGFSEPIDCALPEPRG